MDTEETKKQSPRSGISGDVMSVDGITLSSVRVTCNGVETKTLADGTFAIGNLEPGTYDVTVSLQGYETITHTVLIQEGNVAELSFCLRKSVGAAKIYGHIFDAESKEIVKKGGSIILVKPVLNEYGQIDREGHFEFANLPTGTYRIVTSIHGYGTGSVTLELDKGEVKRHDFILKSLDVEEPPWG
jgi:hypothetical protein